MKKSKFMTEQELITRLKSGDEEAFNLFFEKYKKTIYNFGLKFCGNREDASDILQETLLNAFKYIKNFKGESKLSTWLYKIASNACQKKKNSERNIVSFDELEDNHIHALNKHNENPHITFEKKEIERLIQKAILKLPEQYRIPLILKDIEGLNHQEMAEILDISVANAKVRLHRARLMLKAIVEKFLREGKNG
ncbi:conserved hypothetical protein [Thermotomaculum hydrothermale]|uniref:RNA polymerase, sigma-24 subunit, ECF subfamily n=1 Tax=Thermotomaculum hydrothermale TaxID=981385 RepID=A0A7R6SZW2_9BACT|nr:RNA polymerase sigma factor [Thermotomaculum hydrothermale]BBB33195.1 conserved hypothetical protein [Thermotomaculum hydrothermale]